tara:strand:- start:806 stop:1759 length:954 start_codon:yes stop_codon:yes gene_type:complete
MTPLLPSADSDIVIDRDDLPLDTNAVSSDMKADIEEGYKGSGERLNEVMKTIGVSDAQVSVWLDVTPKTVYNWRKRGGWSVLENTLLARHLSTDANWLATGDLQTSLVKRQSEGAVEYERTVSYDGSTVPQPLIDRFLPIVSPSEIGKGKEYITQIIKRNATKGADGRRMGISVPFWDSSVPGIPKFSVQIILFEFGSDMPFGTMVGVADDISPIPGDFIFGTVNGNFVSGFFYPIGQHLSTASRAADYKNLRKFVIQKRKHKQGVMDVVTPHNSFELVGVATYKANWLTPTLLDRQTMIRTRMDNAFETRRLDDSA